MTLTPKKSSDAHLVCIKELTLDYKQERVLDSISFSLKPRGIVALLGASGCGKTTLLRLVAGLEAPSGGLIKLLGAVQENPLAFVFQDATLMPWASVYKNVAFPLRLLGQTAQEVRHKVMQALRLVRLEDTADALPHTLSGGMRMRVSIARALVAEPALLLLDEPFSALDEITRFELNAELLRLWGERDMGILLATHSVYEAVFLAERILVFSRAPARLSADISNPAPYPRPADFRTSKLFFETCARVSEALRHASQNSENRHENINSAHTYP